MGGRGQEVWVLWGTVFRGGMLPNCLIVPRDFRGGPGDRGRREWVKVGCANVTSWSSFKSEFGKEHSVRREGHTWAIAEHRLTDDDACARAQDWLGGYGRKGFSMPAGKGPKGKPAGCVGWILQEWLQVCEAGVRVHKERAVSKLVRGPHA